MGNNRKENNNMKKQTWKAVVSAAAIAAGAAIPMAANADTIEINGVTWTYVVNDATAKTVTLGDGTNPAMPVGTAIDVKYIPWTFYVGDDKYTVSQIAGNAFKDCSKLTGTLSIPPTVKKITGHAAFYGTGLTGVSSFGDGLEQENTNQQTFKNSQLTGVLVIPDSYSPNFHNFTFDGCANLTGIIVGTGTARTGQYFGSNCSRLEGVWVKGHPNVTSGTQAYTPVTVRNAWRGSPNLKVVLCGANTSMGETYGNQYGLIGVTGCKVFVPANGKWNNVAAHLGGTNTELIPYGPGKDVDLSIDEAAGKVSATPTTPVALVQVLEAATTFKSVFKLDTRISVTNTLDLTGVTITEQMVSGVTFDRLMFSAKTQAQLNAILDAFPATTPVSIDPTGLTENMVIPETYNNVHVKTVPGVTIKRTTKGLMIVVK